MTPAPYANTRLPAAPHALVCHPATRSALPLQIHVRLAVAGSEAGPGLLLRYDLQGDVSRLLMPAPATPGPADGLWQHSCFEAFVGVAADAAYREFNFSPSGQWASYRFSIERQRDRAAEQLQRPLAPDIDCQTTPDGLSLLAWLPLSALPAPVAGQTWDIGLTAVIETNDHQLSYWALQHPGARPDFHHRGGWRQQPELPALLLTATRP